MTLYVRYSDGLAGSGKTHAIIEMIATMAADDDRPFILCMPTKELADKIALETKERHPPLRVKVIHGGTVADSVGKAIKDHLEDTGTGGQLVVTTMQALPFVRFWPNKSAWTVVIDEELSVTRYKAHNLPQSHALITSLLHIESLNSVYGRVVASDEVEELARNKQNDEVVAVYSDTLRIIDNEHYETYVNVEQYEKLRGGRGKRLAFHSILQPSLLEGFREAYMVAANFEDLAIFRIWQDRDVRFRLDRDLSSGLAIHHSPERRIAQHLSRY
jgi:hypothetical protein